MCRFGATFERGNFLARAPKTAQNGDMKHISKGSLYCSKKSSPTVELPELPRKNSDTTLITFDSPPDTEIILETPSSRYIVTGGTLNVIRKVKARLRRLNGSK